MSESSRYDTGGYNSGTDGSVSSIEISMEDVNWPPEYEHIREAVFRIITHKDLYKRRITAEELITPLNSLADADGRDGIMMVNEKLIRLAFSKTIKNEYCIEGLDNLGVDGLPNSDRVFHARVGKRSGSYRKGERSEAVTDFGIHENALFALVDIEKGYNNPPSEISWRPILQSLDISDELKTGLNTFLKSKQEDKERRAKSRGSSGGKKRGGGATGKKRGRPPNAKKQKTKAEEEKEEREELALKERANKDLKKKEDELMKQQSAVETELAAVRTKLKEHAGEAKMNTNKSSANANVNIDRSNTLYYIQNARAGMVQMDNTGVILKEEIEDGLIDLPNEIDNEASEKTRKRTNYSFTTHGASTSWVPNTHELSIKNRQEETKSDKSIMKSIKDLFSKDISKWSHEAQRIIIASSMFGYGCSDEGTIMIMAGTLKALFIQAGIDIDEVQIGKALFSRATLAEMEVRCAADCVLGRCQEMKDDGIESAGMIGDHGHRGGKDHYAKVLVWAGYDENGNWTIKFQLIDIDEAGHTAVEAAHAIKVSTELWFDILTELTGEEVKIDVVTGDSGGGAAVHNLFEELKKIDVMDILGKMLACDMHNFVKPLEVACVDAWGRQGIGHKTPFQMIWLFVKIIKTIRKDVGRKGLSEMWGSVIEKMRNDRLWQSLARSDFPQAFEEFMSKLEELEEVDPDAALKMAYEAPANIQDPVFSRWGTVLAATSVFVEHWAVIYFFALTIKDDKKSDSYLWQMACALLSLMNNRDDEPTNEGESMASFISSFTDENQPTSKLEPGETPTFLAVLYFLDGFNKAYFDPMFKFLMQQDPFYGKGSFGQMARFGSVRQFVMHKELEKLETGGWENGGWRKNIHFKNFIDSLEGVGGGKVGIPYFKKVIEVFFERFRYVFDKWMGTKWRKSSILHYMLAGDPEHAKAFAQYLVHYKEVVLPQFENEDDDEDFTPEPFVFPNQDIKLGLHHQTQDLDAHHKMYGTYLFTVNLRESMEYILSEANREEIIKDPFVVQNWTLIKSLAESDTVVELFSKTNDAKLDTSTWGNVDYRSLRKAMWKRICIHSNHQQRCENMIQLSGLLSKTGVDEVRRTIRAIIVSATIRRFNQWALTEKNKMNEKAGKPPVKRLQGSDKTALWLRFLCEYVFPPADKARMFLKDKAKNAGPGSSTLTHKDICERLKEKDKKVSAKEIDGKIEHWHDTLKSETLSKEVKAEQAAGIEMTGRVSEAVYLRILTGTNSSYLDGDETMSDIADAEIKARGIKVKKKKVSKKMLESMTIAEKRKLLREDELKVRIEEELKLTDIKYIIPQSDEMKRIMNDGTQQRILDKADGIDRIEDSL